jgi:hypothetical protein
MELSYQIRELEKEKERLLASAEPRSNVAGIVTDITFGPSASKMPVTIKVLTNVNTEGMVKVEPNEEKGLSHHSSLSQGGGENHGKRDSFAFRFQDIY